MFIIGEAVIDDAVAQENFCCNLEQCKGACCTSEGGRGAPLEDDEVLEITKAYPIVKQYLDEKNIRTIEQAGPFDGSTGDFATNCIENRECVFAYFEQGIAQCSFEKAFLKGEIDWRKPLSCHLFPVRIRQFGNDFVRYEVIHECAAGRAKGENEKIPLHEFLKVPLVRKYGEAWYLNFLEFCKTRTDNNGAV